MTERYDPERAINLNLPNDMGVFARFGWIGPFPSRPCDSCGGEEFQGGDWNMGYRCTSCGQVFGTKDEWDWEHGQYKPKPKE